MPLVRRTITSESDVSKSVFKNATVMYVPPQQVQAGDEVLSSTSPGVSPRMWADHLATHPAEAAQAAAPALESEPEQESDEEIEDEAEPRSRPTFGRPKGRK